VNLRWTFTASTGATCVVNVYFYDLFKFTVYLRNYLFVFLVVVGKNVVSRNFLDYWALWYKLDVDLLSCKDGVVG
jgi:hypothetical protein